MRDEQILWMGPWGWLGWVLFAFSCGAFGFLWKSSGPTQLRTLNKALSDAKEVIEDLETRQKDMLKRNQKLDQDHRDLYAQHLKLMGEFSQLNVSYGKLECSVAELRKDLEAERGKRDDQFLELMRARAKSGDL